jgi:glycosyltransferase involved in cell wall biosynthesis
MRLLFIHQNFPGQFKHLAPALVDAGHEVVALTCRVEKPTIWKGVRIAPYKIEGRSSPQIAPWLVDFETKLIRGTSCWRAALSMKEGGYAPDAVVAHHGWGESLFLKDVWPKAPLGLYCELYHRAAPEFTAFDPEFPPPNPAGDALRLRMKNLNNRLHEEVMDAGLSPTRFQCDTFPAHWRDRITVGHDGVDTETVRPDPDATLKVSEDVTLRAADEVVTFVNRNLEPYRGYHIFMRALPDLLRRRPDAHAVLIGGDEVSYGAQPPKGQTWKQIFIDEVRGRIPTPHWNRVHFLGRVPYPTYLSMLQVSSAHVYLTYPFVLSWSLIESMAAGCAIVASDTAPVREAVTDGETGLLVDFFDQTTLVDRVEQVLKDRDLAGSLGRAARAYAQRHYDLRSICLPAHIRWAKSLPGLDPRPPQD